MQSSHIAKTLKSLGEAFESDPSKGPATYATATARVVDGLKCRVTGPAGEQLETDMPKSMGGGGSSSNPGWFFRASMAACCATMVASRAAQLGIELTELEVVVGGEAITAACLDSITRSRQAIR
jgi:organic hydroperoxide reductase OsmC/OhrA